MRSAAVPRARSPIEGRDNDASSCFCSFDSVGLLGGGGAAAAITAVVVGDAGPPIEMPGEASLPSLPSPPSGVVPSPPLPAPPALISGVPAAPALPSGPAANSPRRFPLGTVTGPVGKGWVDAQRDHLANRIHVRAASGRRGWRRSTFTFIGAELGKRARRSQRDLRFSDCRFELGNAHVAQLHFQIGGVGRWLGHLLVGKLG